MFTPTWGNDPIWLIFFRWVETTTQMGIYRAYVPLQGFPMIVYIGPPGFNLTIMDLKGAEHQLFKVIFLFSFLLG